MKKFDIITFGSGTKDFYFIFDHLSSETIADGIKLSLGAKIEVDRVLALTGGGGTNVAVGLRKLGFTTAWCGMVGNDLSGQEVIHDLENFKVDTSLVLKNNQKPTNQSVILMAPGTERTILVYRGASNELDQNSLPWSKLQTDWFYLAPLGGKNLEFFNPLLDFSCEQKIRVAINPGTRQITFMKTKLREILGKIDILFVNEEEASLITGISSQNLVEIAHELDNLTKGIWVITRGSKGAIASDKKFYYRSGILPTEVIDKTGAGDSFNSGFLGSYLRSSDMVLALQLGTANAAKNLEQWGAKMDLLSLGDEWNQVEVERRPI